MPNSNLSGGFFITNTDGTLEFTGGPISSHTSLNMGLLKLTCPDSSGHALKLFFYGVLSDDVESQMKASHYDAAIDTLNQAFVALIDDASPSIPLFSTKDGGMQSSFYQNMARVAEERLIKIMRCCAHYVECYYKKDDYVRVRTGSL